MTRPANSSAVVGRSVIRLLAGLAMVAGLGLPGCKTPDGGSEAPSQVLDGPQKVTIEAAPEHLRGRVALPAGARLYARPTYTSPSWSLRLPDPPRIAAEAPPRARAFRVVGVVRSRDGSLGGSLATETEFIAVTNDLDGEDEAPARGCGPRLGDLDHLRLLLYVPTVHLAEVTTRSLELEPLSQDTDAEQVRVGAGTRVGPPASTAGFPRSEAGSAWRWIDADGIRVLAPIPEDAVGLAWDPGDVPIFADAGEQLVRDAEGSMLWLRDDGGASVDFTIRNDCGEHRRVVSSPAEVESLRALALDVFYDQRPPLDPPPVVPPDADYLITAATPLRWPDGDLAGEVLADWAVSVGVGQTWNDLRCFALVLSQELPAVDDPALACVKPESLEPLADVPGFDVSVSVELGGSIEIGPPEVLVGAWTEQLLRPIFNGHHATVSECLRPMLDGSVEVSAARWVLEVLVTVEGRVDRVEVTALGDSHPAVEDCLRAEAFTWVMPEGGGQVLVPVTLGDWQDQAEPEPEPEAEPATEPGAAKDPERGKVIIIRDDEPEG